MRAEGPAGSRPSSSRPRGPSDGWRATLVLSLGWSPRDDRAHGHPGRRGAGEVVIPGCSLEEAEASGRRAANGQGEAPSEVPTVPVAGDGYVCLCEDVSLHDLEQAWDEGWRSSEILKRYTTVTMGPCQGAVWAAPGCVRGRAGGRGRHRGRAPRRVPARAPAPLEDLAAGVDESIEHGPRPRSPSRAGRAWSGAVRGRDRPPRRRRSRRSARSAIGPGCSMSAPWEVPGRRARAAELDGRVFPSTFAIWPRPLAHLVALDGPAT